MVINGGSASGGALGLPWKIVEKRGHAEWRGDRAENRADADAII